jgi:hypothetical protein
VESVWTPCGLCTDSVRICGVHTDRWGTVKYRLDMRIRVYKLCRFCTWSASEYHPLTVHFSEQLCSVVTLLKTTSFVFVVVAADFHCLQFHTIYQTSNLCQPTFIVHCLSCVFCLSRLRTSSCLLNTNLLQD